MGSVVLVDVTCISSSPSVEVGAIVDEKKR